MDRLSRRRQAQAIDLPAIEIGSQWIEYSVVKGHGRRYTYLRFRPDMRLEVVVPRGLSVDPQSTIMSRKSWVLRQYRLMSRHNRVLTDEYVMFGGARLMLVVLDDHSTEDLRPDLENGVVTIRTGDHARTQELVRRWFLRETSAYVIRRLSTLSKELGLRFSKADVREIRNWGYCTRSGRLSFSWQLIALPERLREYVVFHEVAHLSHLNHSRAFRARLAHLCPDYRQRERELNQIVPLEPVGAKPSRF